MSIQRLNAVLKLLNGIELDNSTDVDYLYSRKRSTAFKTIVEFRNCKTSYEVELILKQVDLLPKQASFEKYILIYGKELAKIKMKEFGNVCKNTLEAFIRRYGKDLGNEKYLSYCKKQSFKNTFEGKFKKYGWSKDQFEEYNKSRAVTLQLMIERHGSEVGESKYQSYCDRQAFTNSAEHLGLQRYLEVNKQKAHSLESYINRYGEVEGESKFREYLGKVKPPFSLISQNLFDALMLTEMFKSHKCYYATLNKEFRIYDRENKKTIFCDFVDYDLKLCIEFDGDHYHGNPALYAPDDILRGKGQKHSAKVAWANDRYKESRIKKIFGFEVIRVWESDYKNNPNLVIERILSYAKSRVQ